MQLANESLTCRARAPHTRLIAICHRGCRSVAFDERASVARRKRSALTLTESFC